MKIQVTKDELITLVEDCSYNKIVHDGCCKCVLDKFCHEFQKITDFIPPAIIEVVGEDNE